jgi:hypothetical protein
MRSLALAFALVCFAAAALPLAAAAGAPSPLLIRVNVERALCRNATLLEERFDGDAVKCARAADFFATLYASGVAGDRESVDTAVEAMHTTHVSEGGLIADSPLSCGGFTIAGCIGGAVGCGVACADTLGVACAACVIAVLPACCPCFQYVFACARWAGRDASD